MMAAVTSSNYMLQAPEEKMHAMVPIKQQWTLLFANHDQSKNLTFLDVEKAYRCTIPLCVEHAATFKSVGYWNRSDQSLTTSNQLDLHIDGFMQVRKFTFNAVNYLQRRERGFRAKLHVQFHEN